jgi:predicted FMN-binding regulatory protein PaiB
MYIPTAFEAGDLDTLVNFMQAHSFATLVSVTQGGKYKLSQNRPKSDQQNVARTLLDAEDPAARAIGQAMDENLA